MILCIPSYTCAKKLKNRENLVQYRTGISLVKVLNSTHMHVCSAFIKPNRYFLTHPTNYSFHPLYMQRSGEGGGSICVRLLVSTYFYCRQKLPVEA